MAARLFKSLSRICSFSPSSHPPIPPSQNIAGFTLIELLVSAIIASIVVSGLMGIVIQLLETNQKESAQTETQGDIQSALEFISSELREAVYIYGGDCLQGQGTTTEPNYCPGIVNHIPNIPSNSVPILAFWKLDPLPDTLKTQCNNNTAATTVPCVASRTYSLVVYFLRKNQSSEDTKWSGKARITRYELSQYKSDGTATANYVTPNQPGVNFHIWPYKNNGGTLINLQANKPTGAQVTLVDFVDDTARTGDSSVSCPTNYVLTPSSTTAPFSGVRSFYGCVKEGSGDEAGFNQDAFVFLRGNASGRAGMSNNSFLPALQTQVLRRGIVNKVPSPLQ